MIKHIIIIFICFINISVYAQQQSNGDNSLFVTSESLAFEMGKTYQLAKNCKQDLSSFSSPKASNFFMNYFDAKKVKIIMKQYGYSSLQLSGKSCNREIISIHILINKMADYIRLASPYAK